MGVHKNINADRFPKQGDWLGRRCEVVFHYDTSKRIGATIVRDDAEDPGLIIFRLDDGRHVLATECLPALDKMPAPRPTPPSLAEAAALLEDLVRLFHGMGMGEQAEKEAWRIYRERAPEWEPIDAALAAHQEREGAVGEFVAASERRVAALQRLWTEAIETLCRLDDDGISRAAIREGAESLEEYEQALARLRASEGGFKGRPLPRPQMGGCVDE